MPESKLQSLFTQLKLQDKEEIQYKQYAAEKDKDGQLAAKLRTKLMQVMRNYDLLDDEQQRSKRKESDEYRNRSLFKDKKLNKLWAQAEVSGLSAEELGSLKEEFRHYQDKVDLYYSLLDSLDETSKNRHASTCTSAAADRSLSDLIASLFVCLRRCGERG